MELNSYHGFVPDEGMVKVMVDSGATNSAVGNKNYFVPGSIRRMSHPICVEGVAGDIIVAYQGVVKLEVITKRGETKKLYHMADYVPQIGNTYLLSPQNMLSQIDPQGEFIVSHKGCRFKFGDGTEVETPLDPMTKIPTMAGFTDVESTARQLACQHNLLHPDNQNLSKNQKTMLKWHWKLGHVGWKLLKEVG